MIAFVATGLPFRLAGTKNIVLFLNGQDKGHRIQDLMVSTYQSASPFAKCEICFAYLSRVVLLDYLPRVTDFFP